MVCSGSKKQINIDTRSARTINSGSSDDEGFKKGDYIITKAQASHVASFVAKKVTLKAQDLSNYVRLGLDW